MEKFKKGEKLYLQVEVEFDQYDIHDKEIISLKIESSYAHEYIEFINPKLIRKEDLDKK